MDFTLTSSQNEVYQGEGVKFRIIPNAGYVLDYVKVTDANGNVVTFTSNTFTMSSADVTIEAVFKRIVNPETATNIIGIALVIIISCTVVINKHKNNKKMN